MTQCQGDWMQHWLTSPRDPVVAQIPGSLLESYDEELVRRESRNFSASSNRALRSTKRFARRNWLMPVPTALFCARSAQFCQRSNQRTCKFRAGLLAAGTPHGGLG
jgi:hypothetical protein